jgi:excisionase family DNA binding protein
MLILADILHKKYNTSLLSKTQTAQELNISRATLDRMRQNGEIRSTRIMGQVRFRIQDVVELLS